MKKKMAILLPFLFASCGVQAELIDDFDSYKLGYIERTWASTGGLSISGDWDRYMSGKDGYLNFTGDLTGFVIPDTDSETTLFFRTKSLTDGNENVSFGLDDTLSPDTWDNEFYIKWDDGHIQARNGASHVNIVANASIDVWYNIWMVINNSADTYDIYVNTGASDATSADLVANNWLPRGNSSGVLQALQFEGYDYIVVDDIYMWSGTVLTNPPKAPVPPEPYAFEGEVKCCGTDNEYCTVVNSNLLEPGYETDGLDGLDGWYSSAESWDSDTGTRDGDSSDCDNWHLNEKITDGPLWDISTTQMVEGNSYTFKADVQGRWDCDGVKISIVTYNASDPNVASEPLTTVSYVIGGNGKWYKDLFVSYTATVADVGKYIALMFKGTSTVNPGNSWMRVDNVRLYDISLKNRQGAIAPDPADKSGGIPNGTITLNWTPEGVK